MKKPKQHYHEPPRRPLQFLRWFCDAAFIEEVEGDLYEQFQEDIEAFGLKKARRRFFVASLQYIRPFFLSKKLLVLNKLYYRTMFAHHTKIAFRQLRYQKTHAVINIGGLSLGIASCLIILLFVMKEFSYDRHIPDYDRIYRVSYGGSNLDQLTESEVGVVSAPMAEALEAEFPEVEIAARLYYLRGNIRNKLLRPEGETKNIFEENFCFGDQEIIDLFRIPIIQGDSAQALTQPNTIVISESKARKIFGSDSPIGKTLILNDDENEPFSITAVFQDLPETFHVQFDYLITNNNLDMAQDPSWMNTNFYTYIRLASGSDPEILEAKFPDLIEKYIGNEMLGQFFNNLGVEESRPNYFFALQPLAEMHLFSDHILEPIVHNDISYIWMFGAIALIILLVACINFVNLSTAKAANRTLEIGVRKVIGSQRRELILQFLTESVIMSLLAFLLALGISVYLLSLISSLGLLTLSIPITSPFFWLLYLTSAILLGIIAGLYPAFYLSAFNPIDMFRGRMRLGSSGKPFRSSLVVFQFSSSIVLIIATIIIYRQMYYIEHKDPGFDREQVMILEDSYVLGEQIDAFKQEIVRLPEVQHATISGYTPAKGSLRNDTKFWPEAMNPDDYSTVQRWIVDHDFVETFGMQLIDGRDFSYEFATDTQAVIINETAAEIFGWEDPVGKMLETFSGTYRVIGLVKDYHFESFREKIRGVCLLIGESPLSMAIKIEGTQSRSLLKKAESIWMDFAPNQVFRYSFLDDNLSGIYQPERRMGYLLGGFSILAILITCLGLFALAAFITQKRMKEVTIRKILGASVSQIFVLLTRDFLFLILISAFVGIPLAAFFMQSWLDGFAYRIQMNWEIFFLAGIVCTIIALLTISRQALKTAWMNPAENLRNE